MTHFRIAGTGSCLPEKIITNNDLSEFLDTSDEWIKTRTGIERRHVLSDNESLLSIGKEACLRALKMADCDPAEVDMLICCTLMGDFISPSLSCMLSGALGLRQDCFTIDQNMGCCGFICGLRTADAFFMSGSVKKVLVVSSEAMSRLVDWTDRSNCVLFGDAAGAVLLEAADNAVDFDFNLAESHEHLHVKRAGDNCPYNSYNYGNEQIIHMNGQEVYKFAVIAIVDRIKSLLNKNNLSPDEIDTYLLHQANLRIINSSIQKFGQDPSKFPHTIEETGNTSSSTCAYLLDIQNRAGRFRRGDKVVLCAFGAGLASIAAYIEW